MAMPGSRGWLTAPPESRQATHVLDASRSPMAPIRELEVQERGREFADFAMAAGT
jgi:hypothetical protein